jgi:preprotein translocase SecE subunit
MRAIGNYFAGVVREIRRIRWLKGEGLRRAFFTVIGYAIFFGLFLVLSDFLVIRLLQAINFK